MPIMTFMTKCYHNSLPFTGSFHGNIFRILAQALFAVIIILMISCEEDPSKIGRKILPGSDFVNIESTDTITVRSYTMFSDSIESDNPSTSFLGELYDPYFGSITAEFVTQLRLGSDWDFDSYVLDSVKLYLEFKNVTGNVNKPQYLSFSRIAKQIYTDDVYYSNEDVPLTGFRIENILLPGLKADTINILELDIPLVFADTITRDTAMLFHSTTKPDFRSYFKGLQFEITSPEEPVFASLSIDPPGTYETYMNYFIIFLHDDAGSPREYYLILDAFSKNAAFNIFRHDYSTAQPDKKIQHINDGFADTLTYAQIMNGLHTKLMIPGLKDIKDDPLMKNVSVNRARIMLPIHYDGITYKPSTLPGQIYLRYVTSTGKKYIVPDYSVSPAFYDGSPDTIKNVYNINIASWMQYYLENKSDTLTTNFELFLVPSSANNVILKANNSHTPVKFEFTYTRF